MASRPSAYHPSSSDFDQVRDARRMLQEACELLQLSLPDTFLGRKTFEPFPQESNKAREQNQEAMRRGSRRFAAATTRVAPGPSNRS